ncbi:MAG: PAS domain S-box protein [Methanolinea sp.]|nr:PAS domain S-box protein [Methanolinea sp.]
MISLLYVDDEQDLLEIAREILESSGEFQVRISRSAQDALDILSIHSFDAIIADYHMQGMDGIAFLKAVRERFGDIPFILFTGRGREEVVIDAINHGADFYLQKGGEPEAQFAELTHQIHQAMRRKKAERSLHDSERRLTDIINFLPDATFAIDKEGTVIAWNRAIEEMTGTPASDVLGRGEYIYGRAFYGKARPLLIDLVLAPDAQFERENYLYTHRDNTTLTAEVVLEKPGKNPVHLWSTARILYDENGNLVGAIESVRDITERKAVEEALRESENKFRTIFENSPYPIAINRNPDYKFLEVNKAFLNASGFTEDEVIGKDPMEMGLLPVTEAVRLISRRVLAGKLENIPLALTAKEGRRIHVLFSTMPVTIDNKPAFVTVTAEVTKLKRVEEDLLSKNEDLKAAYGELAAADEELRKNYDELVDKEKARRTSEEKFRALVEHSLDGILITDFSGTLRFVNRAAGLIVDVTDYQATVGTRNVIEFVAPESRDEVLRDLRQVARGIDAYLVRYKLITETKREIWVECVGKKIQFEDSPAMLVSMRDVTGRTLAEERVRESENKFATVFRSNPVALTLVSATDGRFVDVNDVFVRNTGYSRAEVVGKTAEEIGIFLDRSEYLHFTRSHRDQRTSHDMELKCRIKTGEIRTCRFSSCVTMMGGKPHILSTIEDVTERKNAEEALRKANRQLNLLTGITRHDIINKISVILGYLKVARKNCEDPAMVECLEKMQSASTAIRSQIEFTRIYQDLGTRKPQWIDLDTVIPNLQVPATIMVNTEVQGISVFADPMLEKVFSNLLDNSIRHGEHVTAIRVSSRMSGEERIVEWEDDGIGIAADEKERIFERGFGKNSGLGMFLTREILSLTGITIRETGEPGRGARFEICIPNGLSRSEPSIPGSPP